ncbi:hypothetical protein MMC07_005566 [Pseudocyphellaria aurata]|nr:hypothetical protein [Pseudocyphellaria aurata]
MTSPLFLIIRFSPPLPDLPLTIESPTTTTPLNLHALIRPHLPTKLRPCPLRLISAGALLPSTTPLNLSLRIPPTPTVELQPVPTPHEPIYIHCAINAASALSASALAAEHVAFTFSSDVPASSSSSSIPPQQPAPSETLPAGFDALLSAGLSAPEIASLRSQFLALHAHTHTPDTMPSAHEMRVLEERWLDHNTVSDGIPGGTDGAGWAVGGGGGDDGEGAALEDMLWGSVMGFFWAVGALGWLVREEGVWSGRRRGAVAMGVMVNLAVCLLRGLG